VTTRYNWYFSSSQSASVGTVADTARQFAFQISAEGPRVIPQSAVLIAEQQLCPWRGQNLWGRDEPGYRLSGATEDELRPKLRAHWDLMMSHAGNREVALLFGSFVLDKIYDTAGLEGNYRTAWIPYEGGPDALWVGIIEGRQLYVMRRPRIRREDCRGVALAQGICVEVATGRIKPHGQNAWAQRQFPQ
jgi:hypothetical protein